MIITDGERLASTSGETELHEFAAKLKFSRDNYCTNPAPTGKHQHYQRHYPLLSKGARARAIGAGAQLVSFLDFERRVWWSDFKRRQVQ